MDTCTFGLPTVQERHGGSTLVDAYGNWLNSYVWHYYCTFTTRYQLSTKCARRTMQRLRDKLESIEHHPPVIFWVAEPFDAKFGCHLHALISVGDPAMLTVTLIRNAWQVVSKGKGLKEYNNTTISIYDPSKGGHFYISKYLQRQGVDYDLI